LFFFTLVTGPGRSLRLKLSDTRVYEPQIRARLGTTADSGARQAIPNEFSEARLSSIAEVRDHSKHYIALCITSPQREGQIAFFSRLDLYHEPPDSGKVQQK